VVFPKAEGLLENSVRRVALVLIHVTPAIIIRSPVGVRSTAVRKRAAMITLRLYLVTAAIVVKAAAKAAITE
jgi:hypothetical protein